MLCDCQYVVCVYWSIHLVTQLCDLLGLFATALADLEVCSSMYPGLSDNGLSDVSLARSISYCAWDEVTNFEQLMADASISLKSSARGPYTENGQLGPFSLDCTRNTYALVGSKLSKLSKIRRQTDQPDSGKSYCD